MSLLPQQPCGSLLAVGIVLKEFHGRTSRFCRQTVASLLKFFRRPVAQCGVKALPIVVLVDKFFDVGSQMFQVLVLVGVDLFPLQGLDETFAAGIRTTLLWLTVIPRLRSSAEIRR